MKTFEDFALNKQITKALDLANFIKPTPIQNKIIPLINERLDILGVAQTGTGKTAAYLLPILHNITIDKSKYEKKSCKTIIIAPTRELAVQIFDNLRLFSKFLSIRTCLIVGGVKPKPQLNSIFKGVDILVGTPGRIMDHLKSGGLSLKFTKTVVLDEADQLMDLGFMPDIKKMYIHLPKNRQTIFITATMLKAVKEVAVKFLRNYKEVNLSPKSEPIEKILQKIILVEQSLKLEKLKSVIEIEKIYQAIIFTRTKKRADNLAKALSKNKYSAMSFHGDKRQTQRTRILNNFKNNKVNFLIATDVAARGIDINDIMFIINYDLPTQPEIYVHRIGRTARAGKDGTAISFCDKTEKKRLVDIEKLIGYKFKLNDTKENKVFISKKQNNKNSKSLFGKNRVKRKFKNKSIKNSKFSNKKSAGKTNSKYK